MIPSCPWSCADIIYSTSGSIANLNSEKLYLKPALQQQKPKHNCEIAFFTLVRVSFEYCDYFVLRERKTHADYKFTITDD